MPDDYDVILKNAHELGRKRHKDAPPEHHDAFANAVACLVTGMSGGYGGPSMREHAVSYVAIEAGRRDGTFSYDEAVKFAEPYCYGPMTHEIARMLEDEHCFDDSAEDLEQARRLLQGGDPSLN